VRDRWSHRTLRQVRPEAGIDPRAFPVQRLPVDDDEPNDPVVHLPLRAISTDLVTPYAGSSPARFPLRVRTDDRPSGLDLTRAFTAAGFPSVAKRHNEDLSKGFAISGRAVGDEPAVCEVVREILERAMLARGVFDSPITFIENDEPTIEILAPFGAHRSGRLKAETNNPKRFSLEIRGDERLARDIGERLGRMGFDRIEVEATEVEDSRAGYVEYGGAPRDLIDRIRTAIEAEWGESLRLMARKA